MKSQLAYLFCIYCFLLVNACTSKKQQIKTTKVNIETLDFGTLDVDKFYAGINYKRSDLVPADSIGYYMFEKGMYYKLSFDFYEGNKDSLTGLKDPLMNYISYEVLDWRDSDVSEKEALGKTNTDGSAYGEIRQVAYFGDLGFEYANLIADSSGHIKGAAFKTRQNKTDKGYYDQVVAKMITKLGKPFKSIRPKSKDTITWPMEADIWLIHNKLYQFSTLINTNDRAGVQLLILDKSLIKLFENNENPKYTLYLDDVGAENTKQ